MAEFTFAERAENAREAIKKLVDNAMVCAQDNRHTGKVLIEINFNQGGCTDEVTIKNEERHKLNKITV